MHTFVQEQVILTHETDFQGLWRPDAAFRLMQEVAGAHSSQLGLSRSELVRNNIVWMIARAQLRIDRYPRLHDVVRAKTWYGRAGHTTFPRYVEIYGADGALLAAMSTSWILVDIVSRRILLPEKAGLSFPPPAELTPPLPEPGKLRLKQDGAPQVFLRAPLYSDIDVNGHMNNASYVGWILDLFPLAKYREQRLRSLYIGYSAEARPGEQVQMKLYQNDDQFEVLGADAADGRVLFEASGEWQPFNIMQEEP